MLLLSIRYLQIGWKVYSRNSKNEMKIYKIRKKGGFKDYSSLRKMYKQIDK